MRAGTDPAAPVVSAGLDGCRRGWVLAVLGSPAAPLVVTVHDRFGDAMAAADAAGAVAVGADIPIGLPADGRRIAAGCNNGTAYILDAATLRERRILRRHDDIVWSVAFSSCSRFVASGSLRVVWIRDVETGNLIRELRGPENIVWSVALPNSNAFVVSAGSDQRAIMWALAA